MKYDIYQVWAVAPYSSQDTVTEEEVAALDALRPGERHSAVLYVWLSRTYHYLDEQGSPECVAAEAVDAWLARRRQGVLTA